MSLNELKILLADDDEDDCLFFEKAVVELPANINFTAVHNGEQLMHLLTNANNTMPHILFLDLNMPRKNGFECLVEIKQNETLKNLPVVIFSTSYEQDVVNGLYQNGAHYFIRKPSEYLMFKKMILYTFTLLQQNRNTAQPSKEEFVLSLENSLTI